MAFIRAAAEDLSVLSVLPIAIVFLLGQRYFIQGVTMSGIKG